MFEVLIVAALAVIAGAAVGVVTTRSRAARTTSTAAASPAGPDQSSGEADGGLPWDGVVGALRIGVVVADADGNVVWENDAATTTAGSRHGRLLVDAACERLRDLALRGDPAHEAVDFAGPPPRSLEITALALADAVVACFIEDVTEKRRLEQARTDLVANISHELKTPVGAISVLAETLAAEAGSDVVARLTSRMVDESQRMARTIEDLIELSRVEMGAEMMATPVDLASVAGDAIERVRALAERDGITLRIAPGDECTVSGDPHQLRSAVRNLVDNAVHYSHPGGEVEVRVRRDGHEVRVEVEDHGIGIPSANLDRIFERFYRVDRARSRVTGGTGIGLSIVRHVANNHGARVQVRSVEGEGSTFTVSFPAAAVAAPTQGGQQ